MSKHSLQRLAAEQYLYLTTTGRRSGQPRTVELWFVLHEGKVYMVSGDPQRTYWVRNLQAAPSVNIRIGNIEMEGTARVLSPQEQPLWDTVNRLACEKYGEPEPWGTPVEVNLPDRSEQ